MENTQKALFAVFDAAEMELLARRDLVAFLRSAADQLEAEIITGWFSAAKPSGFDRAGDDMRLMVTFGLRVPLRLRAVDVLGVGEAEPLDQLRRDGDVPASCANHANFQQGNVG